MENLDSLSIPEIKERMKEVYQDMNDTRIHFNSLNSDAGKLMDILNKKRIEFFEVKVGDIIEFDKSFRIGKYGFLNEKMIKVEVTNITDKFIKGDILKGDLVIFKGKTNKKYDYINRKNFSVRKLSFVETMATNSIHGKALDRDSEIDNILNKLD